MFKYKVKFCGIICFPVVWFLMLVQQFVYEKYIASLPEGSPTVEFFYSAKGVYVLPDREDFPDGGVIK